MKEDVCNSVASFNTAMLASPVVNSNTVDFTRATSYSISKKTDTKKSSVVVVKSKASDKYIHLDPVPDFTDKVDIKPWLQRIFYPQGVELVIERSDNIKVVFKCKAAKRGKNAKQPLPPQEAHELPSPLTETKKKRSVSRFNTCPFRIRATYSVKREKWNVVIVNNNHSHQLAFNPESDEYKKFKDKLRANSDIEAIKQFDELEYRVHANLPINPALVPCDCGLTNEIQSFNVLLPAATTVTVGNPTSSQQAQISSSNKSRPKIVKTKKNSSLNISQQNLLKKTTTHNFLSSHPHGYVHHTDSPESYTSADSPPQLMMEPNSLGPSFLDEPMDISNQNKIFSFSSLTSGLDEIDFTNMFNKPVYQKKHNSQQHHNGYDIIVKNEVNELPVKPESLSNLEADVITKFTSDILSPHSDFTNNQYDLQHNYSYENDHISNPLHYPPLLSNHQHEFVENEQSFNHAASQHSYSSQKISHTTSYKTAMYPCETNNGPVCYNDECLQLTNIPPENLTISDNIISKISNTLNNNTLENFGEYTLPEVDNSHTNFASSSHSISTQFQSLLNANTPIIDDSSAVNSNINHGSLNFNSNITNNPLEALTSNTNPDIMSFSSTGDLNFNMTPSPILWDNTFENINEKL